jgi:hypothetical protein
VHARVGARRGPERDPSRETPWFTFAFTRRGLMRAALLTDHFRYQCGEQAVAIAGLTLCIRGVHGL